MSESPGEIIAGAATLAVAVGFFVYAAQGGGVTTSPRDGYDLNASFRSAEGIAVGSDVRLAGVKVGTVTGLDLNRQTFRADMTLNVDGDLEVPEDSSIAISSEGLLGGNFVELVPGGSPFNLEPGGEIEDTQGALSLLGLLAKFVSSSEDG
ncbi:outer membrane lipid asymmetry maintenance protein MlaD [Tropicimonas isoalkanivorans]|uniref:Phospholipid/cholesterol/gamma-HCH transport system substrate-binding protein n=1 Tax=Tropicimonas isoalkanivorans TaxID=441112 RepID=A0A1I1GGR3_9RHOB|nr:outer membrane lipid asymmetry maintenance protein MlaD [Tropicimonas isoalkanivorans]SFC10616.1 phospholipid/cholesterol/gamma-HCH transport system substrate-binding protein [Tropicimonas isoalkanivorans]